MARFTDRLKHAWDVFSGNQDERDLGFKGGWAANSAGRPDRVRLSFSNERSIIAAIYTRLSIDVASIALKHVRLDDEDRYLEEMPSYLNQCLTVEANLDQAASHFRQDIALTLFDKGVLAIVPVETSLNPNETGGYDIHQMRVGHIVEWFPTYVKVDVYNEKTGKRERITVPKRTVAIVENPLYAVMNEPNSTLQRLIRKLNLLDAVDEQSSSGKLDLIIQLPYTIKTEARRQQAEQRRRDIEMQLKGSQYGIAYTDGTEKVTQLNRAAENNLLKQIEYLTTMLYGQLGLTEGIMNGTADEVAMLNYHQRTIKPIVKSVTEAMKRSFLTKTARTQKQSIVFLRDPFELVPVEKLAEIADKFTRNEIMSSNEFRHIVGRKPSKDPKADQLQNSNMPAPSESEPPTEKPTEEGDSQNGRR